MLKLIEKDFTTYNPVETWYCESVAELSDIPESAPVGSIAQVLTSSGLTIKMKNSAGSWIDL